MAVAATTWSLNCNARILEGTSTVQLVSQTRRRHGNVLQRSSRHQCTPVVGVEVRDHAPDNGADERGTS